MGIAHWVWKQPLKEPVGDLTERFDLYRRYYGAEWWPANGYLAFRHSNGRFFAVREWGAWGREDAEHAARRALLEGRAELIDITEDMTEAQLGAMNQATLRANLPQHREAAIAQAVATYRNGDGIEVSVTSSDMGPQERRRHDEVIEEGTGRKHAKVLAAPLDVYRNRGSILNRQWEAGDRLRSDHYLAGFEPRRVANLDGAPGGGAPDTADRMPDRVVAALQRYKSAMHKLGLMGRPIIQHVVLNEEHAGTFTGAGYAGGRQAQIVGMGLLRMALDILSDHYGLGE
jgi:hypothetical protein